MSYTLNRTGQEIDAIFDKVDSIFFAVYGTTTYAEISSAISAGKRIYAFDGSKLYNYIGLMDGSHVFGAASGTAAAPSVTYASVTSGSSWSASTTTIAGTASPALTGTPTAPTATSGDSSQQIANTEFVTEAVADEATARSTAISQATSGMLYQDANGYLYVND